MELRWRPVKPFLERKRTRTTGLIANRPFPKLLHRMERIGRLGCNGTTLMRPKIKVSRPY